METEKYKILIADDEYWTREKLRRMIDWEQYRLEFQEPAVDGEDVLRKIEESHPDILITDINMPYLDGVELLKILQERYPGLVTFVISGYDDFTYAKETFMAGSINYLVKPVSKIDLISAVSRALELLSERKQKEQETQKAASYIQDMEFSRLLVKKSASYPPNIVMNSSLDYAGVTLILMKIHNMKQLSARYGYDMNLLSRSVKKKLRGIVREDGAIIFNYVNHSNEFILVSEKENHELRALARRIADEMEAEAQSPVSVVCSDHSFSLDNISQAYVQAVALLMTRSCRPESQILFPDKQKAGQEEIRNHFDERQKHELAELIRNRQAEQTKRMLLDDIGIAGCREQGWQYLELRQTVKRVVNFMQECVQELPGEQESAATEDMAEVLDNALELLDLDYVCELLCDYIDGIMAGGREEEKDGTIRGTVRQAAEYIRAHYCEPLTLRTLSERYHVESTYFSRMFRSEMGRTLLQYIAWVRVEKAKEYIRGGAISLTETAFLVGYDDYTYFNRVFRKTEGKSPSDYRAELDQNAKMSN